MAFSVRLIYFMVYFFGRFFFSLFKNVKKKLLNKNLPAIRIDVMQQHKKKCQIR